MPTVCPESVFSAGSVDLATRTEPLGIYCDVRSAKALMNAPRQMAFKGK